MTALAISLTWVNGVFEVKTFADRVAFDNLVAHFEYARREIVELYRCRGERYVAVCRRKKRNTSQPVRIENIRMNGEN
jgi:hypothetical protein